jgi:hypothetical protein
MTIQRMEHVGIVVDDLKAATEFFATLGLTPQGKGQVEGGWVDRVVGLCHSRRSLPWMRSCSGGHELPAPSWRACLDAACWTGPRPFDQEEAR